MQYCHSANSTTQNDTFTNSCTGSSFSYQQDCIAHQDAEQ